MSVANLHWYGWVVFVLALGTLLQWSGAALDHAFRTREPDDDEHCPSPLIPAILVAVTCYLMIP